MENYIGTTINKLFIKDGKPFITSSNIQYELGSKTSNPEFKIEDNYMINGKDVLQILPKLSSDITLCMTTTNDGEKLYKFSSESEIAELKESLKKQYDEKYHRLNIDLAMSNQEDKDGTKRAIDFYKEEIDYYRKKSKYLENKILKHNYNCIFDFNKIKINYKDIK